MYSFLFAVLLILYWALKGRKDEKEAKKLFIIVMTLCLSLVSGLRNIATGIDTADYYLQYERIQATSWSAVIDSLKDYLTGMDVVDPGYSLFVKVVQVFCPSFYFFNFLVALIVTSAIGLLIYHGVSSFIGYVVGYSYYLSLLYWNVPNNLTRQSLAIGFIIFVLFLLMHKKKLWAVALLFLAILVHRSALIGFINICLLYVKNVKSIRIIYLSSLILTPLVFIFGQSIVDFMVVFSGNERYQIYLGSETDARPVAYFLEMFFFYFIGLVLWKRELLVDNIRRVAYASFALSVIFVSMLWINSNLIRIGMYFSIFGVVFLPYCIENASIKVKGIMLAIVLSLLVGRSLIRPQEYNFYWEDVELSDRYKYYRI